MSPRIVRDGIYYGVGLAAAGFLISFVFSPAWGSPFFLTAAFTLYFFRDPERQIPYGPCAVSPADGKVVEVRSLENGAHRISVFLNIFNVHVNRVPIAGRITKRRYQRGCFRMAHRADASTQNEQNVLTIEGGRTTVVVKQIAGWVARRIVCYKDVGETVEKGERFGLIKFGSRMDILLGPEWDLTIRRGDHVKGGSSVIARLRE